MNEKIISLLLICLVALSIVYCFSSAILPSHATQSIDSAPFRLTTVTEESRRNVKLSYPKPIPGILGDPIDNPRPK